MQPDEPETTHLQKWVFLFYFVPLNFPVMRLSILLLAVLFSASFTMQTNSGNATVQKIQGLDVYVYSEPSQKYEVIESGKVLMTLTGGCGEVVTQAVKKSAKVDADAVIVHLESSKWDAIKYKLP